MQVFRLQKDQEKQFEKFDCPVYQIKMCQKKQDFFRVSSFYIHGKELTNRCASTKGKVEVWSQYHIRPHKGWKYVNNNIDIFDLLWGLIWKILIGKYFEDSAWMECLKLYDKKKSSKWFYLVCHKIIAKITDSVVCGRCLKLNHLSCTFFKKLRKVDIANLILKIGVGNRAK